MERWMVMVLRSSSHIIRPDVVCGVDDAMVMAVSYMYSVPSHLLCWRLFITQLLGNQSHQVKWDSDTLRCRVVTKIRGCEV